MSPPIVGRAALDLVCRGAVGADDLSHLARTQARDHRRADQESEQQRRDRGTRRPKADVVEEIEDDVGLAERSEQVIEHRTSA